MSHGNSSKQFKKQLIVNQDLCNQISSGSKNIIGVMIESNLFEGNQSSDKKDKLEYGQSITDACVGWEDTKVMLNLLSSAVKNRRQNMKVSA
jgi:3-deoxy-7-phosphoheptulonate synthase